MAHELGIFRGYTHAKRPVRLAFSQEFATREEALRAERQIKGWSRAKKRALCEQDWDALRELARSKSPTPAHGSTGSPRAGKMPNSAIDDASSPFVLSLSKDERRPPTSVQE
jgi:GIY-YIG catalytic domain